MNRTKELKELAKHMRETATWLRYYGGFNRKEQNLAAMLEDVAQSIENDLPKEPGKTDWFPAYVCPARDGVYEVKFGSEETLWFSKFSNGKWRDCDKNIHDASSKREESLWMQETSAKWRGLTHEAK